MRELPVPLLLIMREVVLGVQIPLWDLEGSDNSVLPLLELDFLVVVYS